MGIKILSIFKKIDWLLIVAVFLLVCFGLSSLYSLGLSQEGGNFYLLNKQILFFIIGFLLLLIFTFFDYRWLHFLSGWLYLISIILLILVLFIGQNLKGTTGWFVVGGFSFQPIELAKLTTIMFLAKYFTKWQTDKYQIKLWLKTFLIILPICILTMLQPDFGSTAVILFIWFGMLCFSGINKKHLLIFLLILIVVSTLGWQFILHDYQKIRILSFINPQADLLGAGYNTNQSIIAIGSGGLFGKGLSQGTQNQLHFLPVSEADFIFSAIGEELGFIGLFAIFILFIIFFFRIFKILKNTKSDFGVYLISGFCLMFFVQMVINIGMAVGALPVTGLPLPFVSYGGSFLVISLISIGIIQSVKLRQ